LPFKKTSVVFILSDNEGLHNFFGSLLKKAFLIPVSIFIIIGVFLITPTGQAFAENVYHTVIHWFDSSVNIHHGKSDEIVETDELNIAYYKTIQDVRDVTNEKIASNNDNSIADDILVEHNGAELRLVTNYSTSSNSEITITQAIIEGNTEWNTNISSDDGIAIDITLPGGTHFVGYVNDNYCLAVAYQNNMSVQVYSEKSDYDSFTGFIRGIQID